MLAKLSGDPDADSDSYGMFGLSLVYERMKFGRLP